MAAPIALRLDYCGDDLRARARRSRNAGQARRLLALAAIYDGASRTEAARIGGVTLQIVRDWVLRFNDQGPTGLIDRPAPGAAPKLDAEQRAALAKAVEDGPKPYLDGVVRWRICDLTQWVWEEFEVTMSEAAMSRTLKSLGFAKLSARPQHHAQDPEAIETFKKTFPPSWRRSESGSHAGRRSRSGSRTKRA